MVGCDDELRRGRELAVDAAAGRGRLLLIRGEPGIGKTVLLRAILEAAADLIPDVVTGAADQFDHRLPFATLHSCVQPLEDHSSQAVKVLELIRDGGAENPVIDAALMLVEERCLASPVAVAVENLQWADPASIVLLHRLGKIAARLPLLLAATVRDGSGRRDLDSLVGSWRSQGAVCIRLGPLPDAAVDQLIRHQVGAGPGAALRRMVAGAAGNPLYIGELIGGLARGDCLQAVDDVIDVESGDADPALPPALRQAIIGRLATFSPGTRHMLEVAALIGGTFSLADVAAVMGCPATQLLSQVREATEAGVIVSLPDTLAFRHPLVRTVLDDDVFPSARQALHLQIAQTLSPHACPERVAGHLLAAGPAAGPLVPWLASVADDIAARAPALAAGLLTEVLDTLAVPAGEVTDRLRSVLAAALLRTGQPEEAGRVARAGLAAARDPRISATLRWALASACASLGATDRAVEELDAALATGQLTLAEQARFHGLRAQYFIADGVPGKARVAWQESVRAARASGDTEALAHGMAAASATQIWDGRIHEALTFASTAVEATESLGPRAGAQLAPHLHIGVCLGELDHDAEADQAFQDAFRMAERGIGRDHLICGYNCTARLRFWQGRWDEALTQVQAGLDLSDRTGMGRHLRGVAALIAVHRGDRKAAASLLEDLSTPQSPTWCGQHSADMPALALARAAQADGDIAGAAAILGQLWGQDMDKDHIRYLRHYLVPDLVALLLADGVQAAARRVADSIREYASQRTAAALRRSARYACALAEGDAAQLLAVADEYEQAGRVPFAAQAREHAGSLLAAAGQAGQAQVALCQAVAGYESLKSDWDLARTHNVLRTLGVRPGKRGPRRRPRSGWQAMTDTERRVADMVAEGLSNPQIGARMYVSRRTVQFHVSSILTKLGIASRVELAVLVTRQGRAVI
jgi:DNA-binding CsgD family transcriptional regulator/tetratricopeptide (TPR) repeat protein